MSTENGYMQLNPGFDKLVAQSEDSRKRSLQFLMDLVENKVKTSQGKSKNSFQSMKVPVNDTFAILTEDTTEMVHDWEITDISVSENEVFMQINYDLCSNFFFYGQYDQARKYILLCNEHKERLIREKHPRDSVHKSGFDWTKMEYASVTEAEIFGFMKALNISQEMNSLLHQLHETIANNYEGLISVLEADNLKREIPLVHRLVAELDIQGKI